jgi:uncharacterized protein involved in exopolysaccharide biosynthesis
MEKFVEAVFRYKWLLLLPPLLITAIVTPLTILTAPILYESHAGIWVDRPTYLTYSDNWNQWASPAQNQTSRLTELLKTQSFVVDVANRTSLAPLTTTPKGMDRIQLTLSQGLSLTPIGTHLVAVYFRAESPQIAYQMLTGIVAAFNDNMANDQVNQSSLATSFYSDQLQQSQDDLKNASDNLRRYIQSNPSLSALDPTTTSNDKLSALSATDSNLQQLRSAVATAQDRVAQLRTSLQTSEFQASASVEGQSLGFQVIDAPNLPTSGGRDLKKRIIYPVGALIGSLALSSLIVVLLAMSDKSVRSERDLSTGVRVVGEIPYLRLRKIPRKLGQVATRRAIGFVAGAALPAPRGAK